MAPIVDKDSNKAALCQKLPFSFMNKNGKVVAFVR
jgi:hypothetical protein